MTWPLSTPVGTPFCGGATTYDATGRDSPPSALAIAGISRASATPTERTIRTMGCGILHDPANRQQELSQARPYSRPRVRACEDARHLRPRACPKGQGLSAAFERAARRRAVRHDASAHREVAAGPRDLNLQICVIGAAREPDPGDRIGDADL